ncbi:hypothetical protein HanHA300_Chr02g0059411 [Helianthus annuus]|nr:hypothetical protein HanHA300_Chr02g0059411 [Helianthus annuus]KAJ0619141.1 hypothetical protein HanHA89_Chr02g0067971 [Helianthus annuus]KAJ0777590.1 hypothetical protein HanLR1_Chr02g0062171 [Helianthus annuus]KAJ0786619.1 hypothetical protein HanOQP8_Chr02g0073301 [Helianthus annuus]
MRYNGFWLWSWSLCSGFRCSCMWYKRSKRSNGKRRVSPPRVLYFLQFFVRVGTAPTDLEILQERSTLGFNNTGDMGRTIETITL